MVEYFYAVDIKGRPVHIEDAVPHKRNWYFCPVCERGMVVKNEGRIKAHHFAHYDGTSHSGESAEHSNTILYLQNLLESRIKEQRSITVKKTCSDERIYKAIRRIQNYRFRELNVYMYFDNLELSVIYDILESVTDVRREYTIPGTRWRPDLALLNVDGHVIRVIEVFHSHTDDPGKTEYYKTHSIDVVKLDSVKDQRLFTCNKSDIYKHIINSITLFLYGHPCQYVIPAETILNNYLTRRKVQKINIGRRTPMPYYQPSMTYYKQSSIDKFLQPSMPRYKRVIPRPLPQPPHRPEPYDMKRECERFFSVYPEYKNTKLAISDIVKAFMETVKVGNRGICRRIGEGNLTSVLDELRRTK